MTKKYGKYKIYDDDKTFEIHYSYTFSDIIGSILYILAFLIGLLVLYASLENFLWKTISSWILLTFSLICLLFGFFHLVAGFYKPKKGIFQIDKTKKEVIIRDLLKSERIDINSIKSASYELTKNRKPKEIYSMLYLLQTDNKKKDCFIVRSQIPFDIGNEIEKDIHSVSKQLRDEIMNVIKKLY